MLIVIFFWIELCWIPILVEFFLILFQQNKNVEYNDSQYFSMIKRWINSLFIVKVKMTEKGEEIAFGYPMF